MKAALLLRPGEIVIDDVPAPEPGPGEVRITVGGVGLCGSDLAVFTGTWTPPRYPWIQGHEAFGTIDAVGERVSVDRVGEVVVVEPNVACFECGACSRGLTSSCTGRQSVGMNRPGALAEQLVVPSNNAWSVPGHAARDLVCVEPLAVIEAAFRRMGNPPIGTALVIGVGSQGLLATLSLVARGTAVLVHDVNPARVALAISLGARALDPDDAAVSVDLVVDTVGMAASVDVALRHLSIGGTLLVLSLDATPFELSAQTLVRRQLVVRGSLTYDHPGDFEATVGHVRSGAISPGRVITDEYPLDETRQAFERSRSAGGKTWIRVAGSVPG
jgi:2-desacetyl-2-hydroxyethyl bacteriochlorophyllide A dehydrogenase